MYLLDTDTVIYALKGQPDVVRNLALHVDDPLGVSVVTLMELYYGAFRSFVLRTSPFIYSHFLLR